MKITQSKAKNMLATIKVEVSESDYSESVDRVLKRYRKDAVVAGFRKGKTPMSIIEKQYKTSVIVDEVNKLLQDSLYKHITDNKVKVLGSPLPKEEKEIDWKNDTEFTFEYEIGLAPELDFKISNKDKLTYYNIKADNKLVDKYCNDIAKRYGKMSNPSESIDGDLVYCLIIQKDSKGNILENGISNEATVSIESIKDKKYKKQFIGLKADDKLSLNVMNVFKNQTDLSAMLKISQVELNNLSSDLFEFTVKRINRLAPAELKKDLFEKVYPNQKVNKLSDFKNKIKAEAEKSFEIESDRMLKNDVVVYLIDKLKLKMPDDFLKKWLVKTSEQPITMEMLDSDYPIYVKSLQWQLIENKILQKHEIQVTEEEALDHTKKLVAMQMRQYGQLDSNIDQLEDIAQNILKNQEEKKKIYDQIYDQKTLSIYKENFKLNKKSISYNDFIKLATEKNKKQ